MSSDVGQSVDCGCANASREAVRAVLAAIETHNHVPITAGLLRHAATHEALCRSWIFDVLTGLADALEPAVPSGQRADS